MDRLSTAQPGRTTSWARVLAAVYLVAMVVVALDLWVWRPN